jgi:hypothetical protein
MERREPPVRSSVKSSHAANDNLKNDLRQRTWRVWQPRIARDLSSEDARQIVENVAGFFAVLADWSRLEGTIPANDNERGDALTAIAVDQSARSAERGAAEHG